MPEKGRAEALRPAGRASTAFESAFFSRELSGGGGGWRLGPSAWTAGGWRRGAHLPAQPVAGGAAAGDIDRFEYSILYYNCIITINCIG